MNKKREWKDLFVKHTFFTENYKYYIAVISASATKEEQKLWAGRVESKVRTLVIDLEKHESIALAHPFNKGFQRTHKCSSDEEVEEAKNGSLEHKIDETVTTDINHDPSVKGAPIKEETATLEQEPKEDDKSIMVYTDTFYVGLELHEGKGQKSAAQQYRIRSPNKTCTC